MDAQLRAKIAALRPALFHGHNMTQQHVADLIAAVAGDDPATRHAAMSNLRPEFTRTGGWKWNIGKLIHFGELMQVHFLLSEFICTLRRILTGNRAGNCPR